MNRLKKKVLPNYVEEEETYNSVDEGYTEEDTLRPLASNQKEEQKVKVEEEDKTPLALLKEVKKLPSKKGTYGMVLGGRPVDLHSIEDYVARISPYAIKTLMRYDHAKNIEEIKNYAKGPNLKMKGGTLMLIIFIIMMLVGGLIMIFFLPDIMQTFAGGF